MQSNYANRFILSTRINFNICVMLLNNVLIKNSLFNSRQIDQLSVWVLGCSYPQNHKAFSPSPALPC